MNVHRYVRIQRCVMSEHSRQVTYNLARFLRNVEVATVSVSVEQVRAPAISDATATNALAGHFKIYR